MASSAPLPAADGWLAIALDEPQHWSAFCGIIDALALLRDPRFATAALRVANQAALAAAVAPRLAARPRDEWLALLAAAGIPAAPLADGQGHA